MAAGDIPSIGINHPTVDPRPTSAEQTRSDQCNCNDCDFTVELGGEEIPPTCPDCGGAIIRVQAEA